jgi:hypothetical protein
MLKIAFIICCVLITASCSTMGVVVKSGLTSAKNLYAVQPESVRKNYPQFVKKNFYTAEMLTTDYKEWKIQIISSDDLGPHFEKNETTVALEYELDMVSYVKAAPLVYEQQNELYLDGIKYFSHEFSFSSEGRIFWQKYNKLLFDLKKPWFVYQLSPILPPSIRKKVKDIRYKYAPNWGFLTLRQFMDLFDLITDKRWDDFCDSRNYAYTNTSVCGEIKLNDG